MKWSSLQQFLFVQTNANNEGVESNVIVVTAALSSILLFFVTDFFSNQIVLFDVVVLLLPAFAVDVSPGSFISMIPTPSNPLQFIICMTQCWWRFNILIPSYPSYSLSVSCICVMIVVRVNNWINRMDEWMRKCTHVCYPNLSSSSGDRHHSHSASHCPHFSSSKLTPQTLMKSLTHLYLVILWHHLDGRGRRETQNLMETQKFWFVTLFSTPLPLLPHQTWRSRTVLCTVLGTLFDSKFVPLPFRFVLLFPPLTLHGLLCPIAFSCVWYLIERNPGNESTFHVTVTGETTTQLTLELFHYTEKNGRGREWRRQTEDPLRWLPRVSSLSNCCTRPLQVTSTINWIERKHPSTEVERERATQREEGHKHRSPLLSIHLSCWCWYQKSLLAEDEMRKRVVRKIVVTMNEWKETRRRV